MATASFFKEFRKAHDVFTRGLEKLCQKAVKEYNKDKKGHRMITGSRINVSSWHPDQKNIDVTVQLLVAEAGEVSDVLLDEFERHLKEVFTKHVPVPKGFEFTCNIQNLRRYSCDD